MKCQVLKVLLPFISFMHVLFLTCHNMLALMLDPKCKKLRLMVSYLGCEAVATLVVDYDE